MKAAGQQFTDAEGASDKMRMLGAQLILSEVLEYIIGGLGVKVNVNGTEITNPDNLSYEIYPGVVDKKEMLDGLADVAYTMYWNALAFNLKLEEAFELVADNNLEKFVKLEDWPYVGSVHKDLWHLGNNVEWPAEVQYVDVMLVDSCLYAVGTDANGKVRKPSTYKPVDLSSLV